MAVTVVVTDDSIVFNIHESHSPRADTHRSEKVLFDKQQDVPRLTTQRPPLYSETCLYWISQRQQWIAFHKGSSFSMFPTESDEYIDGPWLVEDEPPPTAEELAKAKAAGMIPCRLRKL